MGQSHVADPAHATRPEHVGWPPIAWRPQEGRQPDVSISIVHYETPDLLTACLDSLGRSVGNLNIEVTVVDNASLTFDAYGLRRAFPWVRVLSNAQNLGFSRASNQGLLETNGRYVLLLNPDTEVAPDSLLTMLAYMDGHPDVGCATCRLELEDGSLDLACRRLFPTPARSFYRITMLSKLFPRHRRFGQYNLTYLDEWLETEIDQPCGAFMLVRREVVDQVGLLDESYFMYGEDTDWAFRIKAAGWSIRYVPSTTVKHRKRASSRRFRPLTIRYFHQAMRRFYRTHYAPTQPFVVNAIILAAISARERIELTGEWIRRQRAGRTGGP